MKTTEFAKLSYLENLEMESKINEQQKNNSSSFQFVSLKIFGNYELGIIQLVIYFCP